MKVAALLSGGGFTGAFQAGAIARLHRDGIRPSLTYGISVGSLNGAMWASDDVHTLVSMWKKIEFSDIFGPRRNLFSAYARKGLHSNDPLRRMIDEYIDADRVPNTFHAGCVNLTSRTYIMANKLNGWAGEKIKTAILASTAVPVSHTPVLVGDALFVDGGVWNVSPMTHIIEAMSKGDYDRAIVINCAPSRYPENRRFKVKNLMDVAEHSISVMLEANVTRDVHRFRDINELCEGRGIVERKSGGYWRYIPATIIEPSHHLGSGMNADREHLDGLFHDGYHAADIELGNML